MKEALTFLKRKIDNVLTRAVIRGSLTSGVLKLEDGKLTIQVEGLAGETRSDVEHLQQYGIRSIPLDGARGILQAYGGNKDNATVTNIDDKRYGRFELQDGDMCVYSLNGAHTIYRGDDIIEILDGTKTITIGGMSVTMTDSKHEIKIGGMTALVDSSGITVTGGDVVADGISLKNHTHTGSPTAGTGPVTPTGAPI
jgi:phage baseplate assembly protein V